MGTGNLGKKGSSGIGIIEKVNDLVNPTEQEPKDEDPKTASGTRSSVGYNPALDNHFLSPEEPIGLFGMKMKNVERILVSQGAKRHSYAFGKYNKLTLSIYLITIYFDKKRVVSGVSITPKPPYQRIEPHARKYFMELFLDGNSLAQFNTQFLGNRLEVKYIGK